MLSPRKKLIGLVWAALLTLPWSLAHGQDSQTDVPMTPPRVQTPPRTTPPRSGAPPAGGAAQPGMQRQAPPRAPAAAPRTGATQAPSATMHQALPARQPPSAAAKTAQANQGQVQQAQHQQPQQQQTMPALTPPEQAELDQILAMWEQKSEKITTLTTGFTMWEYDAVFGAPTVKGQPPKEKRKCEGVIHFASPDRGSYEVTKGSEERWMCDGKAIYEFDFKQKKLKEYRLPKELQGKAITNGPLPFVFGAQAKAMKERYVMRVFTPPDVEGQIWIEAWPRWQQDAANFHHVHVILDSKTMLPQGIRLFDPVPPNYKVYGFDAKPTVNGTLDQVKGFFSRPVTPLGWQHVVEEPPAAVAPADQKLPGPGSTADARAKVAPSRPPAVKK